MMDGRPTRVLIAGAGTYGYWNTGDEAILVAMLADLRAAIPGLVPVLVSANPLGTMTHLGLQQVRIDDLPALVQEAHAADLLILGGGGIFYDYWGVQLHQVLTSDQRGLALYAGFALTAALVGKPLMIYGVGVGPLASPDGQFLTRTVFDQAQVATVRDPASRELLRGLGHDPEGIRVTADPACALARASEAEAAEILRRAAGREVTPPLIGVAVRNWDIGVDPEQWEGGVAGGLDTWLDRHGGTVAFLPFHRSDAGGPLTDDAAVGDRIIGRMRRADQTVRVPVDLSPDIKSAVIAACDLVLGMRLHSLVFAASGGVPFAAIGYDPKVYEFLRQAGLEAFGIEPRAVSPERLVAVLEELYRGRDAVRGRLLAAATLLAARASDNAALAAGLLTSGAAVSVAPTMVQLLERMHVVDAHLLFEVEARLRGLRANLAEQIRAVQMLESRLNDLDRELDASRAAERTQRRTIQALQEQLNAITSSTGWGLLQAAWRVRRLLLPLGSTRETIARFVFRLIRRVPPAGGLTQAPRKAGRWLAAPLRAEGTHRILRRAFRRLPARVKAPLRRAYAVMAQASLDAAPSLPPPAAPPGLAPAPVPAPALVTGRPRRLDVVNVVTPLFFDPDGREMMRGGAERYLIELAPLIEAMGYKVEVYQAARGEWERRYGVLSVRGLETGGDVSRLNARFHAVADDAALTVYLAFYLAAPQCFARSIGISHGVYWDHPTFQFAPHHYRDKIGEVITAMGNLARIVSVDTNTMNWVRATNIGLARKLVYLPNFVDTAQFRPRPAGDRAGGQLTVLYPRRLYAPRGFWLAAEVLPEFLERFPNLDFRFVGQADPEEERAVLELVRRYPGRVRWDSVPPEEMPGVYQTADITLIPTLAAEGTSLSCLEAQASGNAVVATNVGGLPELILHGFNGLLIEPTAAALRLALQRLVVDPVLRRRLAERAVDVAQSYSLDVWRERWQVILREHLPAATVTLVRRPELRPVAFLAAPGVPWGRMKQRPHHLAEQLAAAGHETYWEDPSPAGRTPTAGVHLVPTRAELPHDRPVVVVFYPYHAAQLEEFSDPFVAYDILDDISIHDGSDALHAVPVGQRARDHHKVLLDRADAVTVASRALYETIREIRPDVLYVPNGVDDRWFGIRRSSPAPPPPDLPLGAGPLIGYHGALGPWFDYTLVERAAGAHPECRFVLIGPASDPGRLRQLLRRRGNIFYLGERSYDELPDYVAQFDIGILPFRLTSVTRATRPLKVLECLAAGIPVAASAMPEIAGWPGVVTAPTEDRFPAAIDEALALRNSDAVLAKAAEFARAASWRAAVEPLIRALVRLSQVPIRSHLHHSL